MLCGRRGHMYFFEDHVVDSDDEAETLTLEQPLAVGDTERVTDVERVTDTLEVALPLGRRLRDDDEETESEGERDAE